MIRSLIVAFALLAIAAPAAAAHDNGHADLPDAEIFATNNTALITDQHDPRLRDRLEGFARRVDATSSTRAADAREDRSCWTACSSPPTSAARRSSARGAFDVDRVER